MLASSSAVLLVVGGAATLADVLALGDTLALAAGGVGVGETLALLRLGERGGLVGAGNLVTEVLVLSQASSQQMLFLLVIIGRVESHGLGENVRSHECSGVRIRTVVGMP